MRHYSVTGGGGTRLNVVETGDPAGRPIVFLHGWSQSHAAWQRQLQSPALRGFRLVAVDLRGHGDSDKPVDGYGESAWWAADLDAVCATLALERPVLVVWSYAGYVIADYLRARGDAALGGIVFVDATTDLLGGNWNTILVDQFGNKTQGGTLTLTRSSGGPYPTNYYYNSSVPTLTRGSSYSVYINQFTSQCTPAGVGTFGT